MATRAGVAECSTSPMAQRSSARSIRASPVTGYWGARRSISASIASRCAITAATSSRASVGGVRVALGLGEVALEDGVRRALAEVGLEDRRERQPAAGPPAADAGQPPTPSTSTVTAPRSSPSRRSTVAATADRTWRGERPERPGRAGRRSTAGRRRASSRTRTRHGAARRAAAATAGPPRPTRATPGTSKRGQPDQLGDDAAPTVSSGPLTRRSPRRARRRHRRASAASPAAACAASASAMSAGTRGPGRRRRDVAGEADHPPLAPGRG